MLDEPTASLDVEARVEVRTFLAESIRSLGLPTILVTHDITDVEALAGRVAVLEKGRVAGCGLLADIRQNPPTPFAGKLFDSSRARAPAQWPAPLALEMPVTTEIGGSSYANVYSSLELSVCLFVFTGHCGCAARMWQLIGDQTC